MRPASHVRVIEIPLLPTLAAAVLALGLFGSALVLPMLGAIFAQFAPLPLLALGFAFGAAPVALAGIVASVSLLAINLTSFFAFAVLVAVPCYALTRFSLMRRKDGVLVEYLPLGYVVLAMTAYAITALVLAAILLGFHAENGFADLVKNYVTTVFSSSGTENLPAGMDSELSDVTTMLGEVFPGFAAMFWLGFLALNTALAHGFIRARGLAKRSAWNITKLRLPAWAAGFLVGLIVLGLIAGGDVAYTARNLVLIAAMPFTALGLIAVHRLAAAAPFGGVMLAATYVLLFVFVPMVAILAVTGMSQAMFGWADKLIRKE